MKKKNGLLTVKKKTSNDTKSVVLRRASKSALHMTIKEIDEQKDIERCFRLRDKISQRIMNTPMTDFNKRR